MKKKKLHEDKKKLKLYKREVKNGDFELKDINEMIQPLSPVNRKQIDPYEEVLADKLQKSNDYNNIALTGVYGSGKSSILKSLDCLKSKRVIHISMAKFEKQESDNLSFVQFKILKQIIQQVKRERLSLLDIDTYKELSLFKAMNLLGFFLCAIYSIFLFIDNHDEAFKNLFNTSNSNFWLTYISKSIVETIPFKHIIGLLLILLVLWIIIYIVPTYNFKKGKGILSYFKEKQIGYKRILIGGIVTVVIIVIIVIVCFYILINKHKPKCYGWLYTFTIIYLIYSVSKLISYIYKKLRIKNINLSLKQINVALVKKDNHQVVNSLSNWSEMIHYIIKNAKIDLIIFEDLDRLEDKDIFWELKDLNIGLNHRINQNNSHFHKKIENFLKNNYNIYEIKFLYVIRDNMFTEEEKTKLFDIIIPIVPILHEENIRQHFLNNIEPVVVANEKLTDYMDMDYCLKIIKHIKDMRTLNDVMNEFYIYLEGIMEKGWNLIEIDINVIFTLVLYKTFYEDDYTQLLNSKGILYHIIQYIEKEKYKGNDDIPRISREINEYIFKIKTIIKEMTNKFEFEDNKFYCIESDEYYFDYHIQSFWSQVLILINGHDFDKPDSKLTITDGKESIVIEYDKEKNDSVLKQISDVLGEIEKRREQLLTLKRGLISKWLESSRNDNDSQIFNDLLKSGYLDSSVYKYLTYQTELIIPEEDLSTIEKILYWKFKKLNLEDIYEIADMNIYSVYNIIISPFYQNNAYFNSQIIRTCLTINDIIAQRIVKNTLDASEEDIYLSFWKMYLRECTDRNNIFQHLLDIIFSDVETSKRVFYPILISENLNMIKLVFEDYFQKIEGMEQYSNDSDFDFSKINKNVQRAFEKGIEVKEEIWSALEKLKIKLTNLKTLNINEADFQSMSRPLDNVLICNYDNLWWLTKYYKKVSNKGINVLDKFLKDKNEIILDEEFGKNSLNDVKEVFEFLFNNTLNTINTTSIYEEFYKNIGEFFGHVDFKIELNNVSEYSDSKIRFLIANDNLLKSEDLDKITKIRKSDDEHMLLMKFDIQNDFED